MKLRVWRQEHPVLDSPENTALVELDDTVIIIDPGPHRSPPRELLEYCSSANRALVLITHCHWDHVRGLRGLLDTCPNALPLASRYSIEYASRIDNILDWVNTILSLPGTPLQVFEAYRGLFESYYSDVVEVVKKVKAVEENEDLLGRIGVSVYRCPGHTMGHLCYMIGDTLFAGDNVTEPSTPVVMDFDAYVETISLIKRLGWSRIVPGHGRMLERSEGVKLLENIRSRKLKRLKNIVEYLLGVGEADGLKLIEAAYGPIKHEFEVFTRAYNTIGYLRSLERRGVVSIEYTRPWRIRLRSREAAIKLLQELS